jgi:8-oxo-dGTP diphosphatase
MIALIAAILLSVILFPIGFVLRMFYPKRGEYLFRIAVSIDQLGNVVCSKLFNIILITSSGYQFGKEDETISSVLGKNKELGTLRFLGKLLDLLLDQIEKDHSIRSIEADE